MVSAGIPFATLVTKFSISPASRCEPCWPVDNMSVGHTMSWADVNIRQAEAT